MNNQSGPKPKNRTGLYVTLLVILMSVALIVAIAGAVAKSVRRDDSVTTAADSTQAQTRQDDVTGTDDVFVTKEDTAAPDTEPDTAPVTDSDTTAGAADDAAAMPSLANPTGGALMKEFSTDVPVFSLTMEDYRTHGGVDISAEAGADVKCAADGVVSEVWEDPMMGKCVSVSHSGGAVSTYMNLAADLADGIEKGMNVSAGTVIGSVGESALCEIAEEPHLHFELSVNSKNVNPADYIDFTASTEAYD